MCDNFYPNYIFKELDTNILQEHVFQHIYNFEGLAYA
jgi:hypothetical protein